MRHILESSQLHVWPSPSSTEEEIYRVLEFVVLNKLSDLAISKTPTRLILPRQDPVLCYSFIKYVISLLLSESNKENEVTRSLGDTDNYLNSPCSRLGG